MDWFLHDNGLRHERVTTRSYLWFAAFLTIMKIKLLPVTYHTQPIYRMGENTDQNNSEYGYFSCSGGQITHEALLRNLKHVTSEGFLWKFFCYQWVFDFVKP